MSFDDLFVANDGFKNKNTFYVARNIKFGIVLFQKNVLQPIKSSFVAKIVLHNLGLVLV